MSIKELRLSIGMSQSKFAEHTGIKLRTLQEWEQERKNPPSYLVPLLIRLLLLEGYTLDLITE